MSEVWIDAKWQDVIVEKRAGRLPGSDQQTFQAVFFQQCCVTCLQRGEVRAIQGAEQIIHFGHWCRCLIVLCPGVGFSRGTGAVYPGVEC